MPAGVSSDDRLFKQQTVSTDTVSTPQSTDISDVLCRQGEVLFKEWYHDESSGHAHAYRDQNPSSPTCVGVLDVNGVKVSDRAAGTS